MTETHNGTPEPSLPHGVNHHLGMAAASKDCDIVHFPGSAGVSERIALEYKGHDLSKIGDDLLHIHTMLTATIVDLHLRYSPVVLVAGIAHSTLRAYDSFYSLLSTANTLTPSQFGTALEIQRRSSRYPRRPE
jgi:hypothetical protein